MKYGSPAIPESAIPNSADPLFQHAVDTYASETNKLVTVWSGFQDADLAWKPHPRSASVGEILKHEILSERRFFAEFLGIPEPLAADAVPEQPSVEAFLQRLVESASARLVHLAAKSQNWWMDETAFFDVRRQRIWVFWRRILHTAHHRTQLTVYLRLLDRQVPSIYGPTADVNWKGSDPTHTVQSAERK